MTVVAGNLLSDENTPAKKLAELHLTKLQELIGCSRRQEQGGPTAIADKFSRVVDLHPLPLMGMRNPQQNQTILNPYE